MSWTSWQRIRADEFSDIIYEKKFHEQLEGGIARITVNRPERLNAMTAHSFDESFHAIYDASHDPMIGVVIFTGAGGNFGVGGDVEWEQKGLREQFYWRYTPNRIMRVCRKPIIAQVRGYCIGGSHHMAYTCDFTLASDNAIFGQNGPRVSSPADGSFIPYLTRVVGAKRAREIWMMCRRYTADQALDMGLVNKVVPDAQLEDAVDDWCEELLRSSPGCLEILKAAFDQELDMFPELGVISGNMYPDWFDSPEGAEGAIAFMQKRKPNYWGIRKAEVEARQATIEKIMPRLDGQDGK